MRYPDYLLKLIAVLKKLPGVGTKSAERFAFELIEWPQDQLDHFTTTVSGIKKNLNYCDSCGALIGEGPCPYCSQPRRDPHLLCVIGSPKDLFSIEETKEYQGYYHVLGGLLSPFQGQTLVPAAIENLKKRITALSIQEVIIALDSTLEGDATALYVKKELSVLPVTTSRLALGLPMGSSLDLIDGGTLGRALAFRRHY